jgi:hypothetical protein
LFFLGVVLAASACALMLTYSESSASSGTVAPYYDSDRDGCDDGLETGDDPSRGGQRDPLIFWDFFDPNRDRSVSVIDFFSVVGRFGAVWPGYPNSPAEHVSLASALSPPPASPAYHAGHDRTVLAGNTAVPDGAITSVDVFAVLSQFGDTCKPGWQPNIVVIMTDD